MNLIKLFTAQNELDKYIYKKHPEITYEERIEKKFLALYTEIGELANELPEEFKYWANKKNDKEKALEELVDVLHFILSLGLEIHEKIARMEWASVMLERLKCLEKDYKSSSVVGLFNSLYEAVSDFNKSFENKDYGFMFLTFLALALDIGFTVDEIEAAYYEKHRINIERQNNGY